ncbi:MAG: type II toxin-antitoxin system HicA family toxin [Bacteroides sp.]|nr:type II toxin-antitoxin system HicA family toxin [Eubacterium sp.]MCM1419647.1 type II toxin-antitoxin system HicA family toxin [Roseburia sp.]MCM1463620.1 type II toxin-antitoxin system HicA family toxin [Bacteroides sp.]
MTFGELKKLLKKNGCRLSRQGSRHEIWYSPITGKQFQLGRHNTEEVATGTLKQIKKDAGLE